jgi:uracil-DNA glycosylase
LDELLMIAGLKREEVFIGNVIKCRPPQNRDPEPAEIETCTKTYLFRQIESINPHVIVTLGRFSMALYIPKSKISQIHGQPRKIDGRLIVPMMHPAAALHQPKNRQLIEDDFRTLPEIVEQARQHANATVLQQSDEPPSGEQLSMF